MHDKRSEQLASVSVVELRYSEKRMPEFSVSTDKSGTDGLDLALVVKAAR